MPTNQAIANIAGRPPSGMPLHRHGPCTNQFVNALTTNAVQSILDSTQLTRLEKIQQLRHMAYEVREMSVATEEGMARTNDTGLDLAVVQRALRSLDAVPDTGSAAKQ